MLPLVAELSISGGADRFAPLSLFGLLRLLLLLGFRPAIGMLTSNLVVPHLLTFGLSKLSVLCFATHSAACLFWVIAAANSNHKSTATETLNLPVLV